MNRLHQLLITAVDESTALESAHALAAQGFAVASVSPCAQLVTDVVRTAPDAVIAVASTRVEAALVAALQALREGAPKPVLLISPSLPRGRIDELLAAGVDEWRNGLGDSGDWGRWLALAAARFARENARDKTLAEARSALAERKWIDRAKGLLMRGQRLDEEQAFALLREASMHANLRLAQVSRDVVEAANAAEAIDRAGQLRMLSQRIVKALALRAAGVDADAVLAASRTRLGENLSYLQTALAGAPAEALAAVQAAGEALEAAVASGAAPALADAPAEQLLAAADGLVGAIERTIGRAGLHIVNVCGRQRMLSQRLAKQVLLAPADDADVQATHAAFERGLADLQAAPLSNDAIRETLAAARGQWRRLLDAAAARAWPALADESEALLSGFERVTALYARSIQVLLS